MYTCLSILATLFVYLFTSPLRLAAFKPKGFRTEGFNNEELPLLPPGAAQGYIYHTLPSLQKMSAVMSGFGPLLMDVRWHRPADHLQRGDNSRAAPHGSPPACPRSQSPFRPFAIGLCAMPCALTRPGITAVGARPGPGTSKWHVRYLPTKRCLNVYDYASDKMKLIVLLLFAS